MTDEGDVEERYRPTKINLVRPFPQPCPRSTYPNDVFPQRREIKALCRGVVPGNRRVFYCMNPSVLAFTTSSADAPSTISRRPFGLDALFGDG